MSYVFGDFELDEQTYQLCQSGEIVAIEPQAFNLLAYLIAHRDLAVSREELFDKLWPGQVVGDAALTYCVAKAGLRMLSQCMALDLAPQGILVNEVAPGYVDAGLSAQFWKQNPAGREKAAGRVPIGQLIDAGEVATQVAHLCEPDNRHMTGTTLLMDGGLSLVTPAAPAMKK